MLKTEQFYKEIEQEKKFQETPDYNRYRNEKKWFEDGEEFFCTGDYYQADYLIQRDMVRTKPEPSKPAWTPPHLDAEGKPLQYPLKYVNGIYRGRIAHGSEWLLSTQEWIALSRDGNRCESINDV